MRALEVARDSLVEIVRVPGAQAVALQRRRVADANLDIMQKQRWITASAAEHAHALDFVQLEQVDLPPGRLVDARLRAILRVVLSDELAVVGVARLAALDSARLVGGLRQRNVCDTGGRVRGPSARCETRDCV